jgi:hypothetical protein
LIATVPELEQVLLPVLPLETVYHVGTLKLADKKTQYAESYEADCLSVSMCPEAWAQIARLGGPTHELTKKNGWFLDIKRLSAASRRAIELWAEKRGYLQHESWYRAIVTRDEDTNGPGYSWFGSKKEALAEVLPEDESSVRALRPWTTTHTLLERRGLTAPLVDRDAVDLAIMTFAEEHDFDGVWWRETYDPDSLSAPRGGILPRKVSEWTATTIREAPDDEEMIQKFPRPTFILFDVWNK